MAPIIAALAGPALADNSGPHDAEFDKVPFAQWFSGAPEARLKWSQRLLPLTLSAHQRLVSRLEIQINGNELVKRRSAGKVIFYFQFADVTGQTYQQHGDFDLDKAVKSLGAQDMICSDSTFVLPGDYTVSFAIFFTGTGEHVARRDTLHVPPWTADSLLPDLWRGLPPVDFFTSTDPPDSWFLPKIAGEVNLPVAPRHPVQIDVVANLAASQFNTSSFRVRGSDLSVVLAYLRVLSQIKGPNVRKSFSLLDVNRRRVVFEQRDVDRLDWQKMRPAVQSVNSGLIDRASLSHREDSAVFFASEVARRFPPAQSPGPRVVIILTGAMTFDTKQNRPDLHIQSSPGDRLIYLRLRTGPRFQTLSPSENNRPADSEGTSRRPERPLQSPLITDPELDELAKMLFVPGLRLFNVQSTEAFRRALAAIVNEIDSL